MKIQTEERFDVVVFKYETGVIEFMAGENMLKSSGSFHTADKRFETALSRLNDNFGAAIVPAGQFKKGDVLNREMIVH